MFRSKAKKEVSSTEIALARLDTRLDRISSLYEPLAVRVANLEVLARTTSVQQEPIPPTAPADRAAERPADDAPAAGHRIGWLRILRNMLPHKVGLLLSSHDELERLQREVAYLRSALGQLRQAELVQRMRRRGRNNSADDTPGFPESVFRADEAHKIAIIDVGAQDLVSEDHVYAPLQAAGATKIIGFEPLEDKDSAPRRADPSVDILDHFVGAGGLGTFHVTDFDPASSLLEPNNEFLSQFVALPDMCRTVSSFDVQTTRLDDVPEITGCDFLKIDVQGGELDVLKGAERVLEETLTVHCEVEFGPVYKNQPLFADIDNFLRDQGFELIDLVNAGYNRYKALLGSAETGSRLLWAEAIYFKSTDSILSRSAASLLKAAYIAHVNYCMYDLASHLLAKYDEATGESLLPGYLADLSAFPGWRTSDSKLDGIQASSARPVRAESEISKSPHWRIAPLADRAE